MAENMNNKNDRQPSLRELANERMRERVAQAKAQRNAANASGESDNANRNTSGKPQSASANASRPKTENNAAKASSQREQGVGKDAQVRKVQNGEPVRKRPSENEVRQNPSRNASSQKSANAERRPSSGSTQRNASQRPAAKDAIRAERNLSQGNRKPSGKPGQRPSSHSSGKAGSSRVSSKQPAKKKFPVFWVGLAVYTVILIGLSVLFLFYTDDCLKKYENSQSENYMASYMKDFSERAKNGSLTSADLTLPDLDLTFAGSGNYADEYLASLKDYSSFTAEKDQTNYITEAPVYNIIADGQTIARITLKAVSQTKIFAILTIMDWDIDKIEPVLSIDVTTYTFLVPDGYTPVINGIAVNDSYKTGNTESIQEFAYVSNYVPMPSYVEYKVDNVLEGSDIKVLNANNEEVICDINGTKIKASYASPSNELPEDRRNEALSMVQTYEDFNTADLSGPNYGLATVQSILIKDSDYWNMAKQWAGGVDITFTSAHVFDDPKYSNVVVDNYAQYSDVCYSVHIAFSKNMILTRTHEKRTNDFDSTVFFVYYDDSDDNTDNPHWCIADIIATTKQN